ncbi:Uncharacterised protein [uncultured archaeon]|nr:Uncharacterised protein [uncultured archaeon]
MDKKVWIGMFFAFIMIFSVFGIVMDSFRPATNLEYKDYKFKVSQNQFFTTIDGAEHGFLFFPADLEYITIPEDAKVILDVPVITVTYDPQSTMAQSLAEAQYYFEAQLQNKKVVERALTNNTDTTLPQKTCADATPAQPVIELALANESSITITKNCITLGAVDDTDIYKETERFIYFLLGVMS